MGKKKFVLRLDEKHYDALEKWAADEFRSVNGQIEWLLYEALKSAKRTKVDLSQIENEDGQED